jgi:hypothetical protein
MLKKFIKYTGILMVMAIGYTGCYQDIILPDAAVDPDGPPQAVSFSVDIAPMVNTKCALSGCHATGGHKPYLTIGSAYKEIVSGGFVNTNVPKESILYKNINGDMREYIPSAVDRQKIYDWIRNGAQNN